MALREISLETDGIFVEASSASPAVLEWVYENREQLGLTAGEHGQAYMHARTPARRNWLYDRKDFVGVSVRVPPHICQHARSGCARARTSFSGTSCVFRFCAHI